MTEHRKIPLTPETSAAGGKSENSSIERAVDTFDLRHFLPPAVPEVLPAVAPRLANRARRIPMSDLGADISGIAASPVGETTADAPVVVEASSELVTFPARKSRIKPVVFSGTHHPIDRNSRYAVNLYANWFQSGATLDGNATALGASLAYYRNLTDRLTATAALGIDGISRSEPLEDQWAASALVGLRYNF
jgi:hypothetical protein